MPTIPLIDYLTDLQNLARHADYFTDLGKQQASPINSMALSETLKLFFNLSNFYPDQIPALTKSLPHICRTFAAIKLPDPPLQPPVTHIINSLLNLDHEDARDTLFAESGPHCHVDRLCSILDQSMRQYAEVQLEALASPLLTSIRHLYSIAPTNVQDHMRSLMLPSNEDRKTPLGKSETFSSYILRLSLAGGAPQIRDSVQNLLFELSDKDASKFVQNVGYGFAAGYLFSHNITVPESALEGGSSEDRPASDHGTASISGSGLQPRKPNMIPVNPITGQRLDEETDEPVIEMTQEEKEQEAERLFVLFER